MHWFTGSPGALVHLVCRFTGSPGAPVHWCTGSPGALVHWFTWCPSALVHLVHWFTWCTGSPGAPGTLVHWFTWCTGSPGCMHSGMLKLCTWSVHGYYGQVDLYLYGLINRLPRPKENIVKKKCWLSRFL